MNKKNFCNYISSLCIKSILYELAASPKPGLVDRYNPGAHDDMDVFTFLGSASVLPPYFQECTRAGLDFQGDDYRKLMEGLRPIGIEAENLMFQATSGINTHKGAIFSLGIIASAVGSLYGKNHDSYFKTDKIIKRVKEMTEGISKELKNIDNNKDLTYGESLYLKYGVKGIRGEVESGFETVINHSLPVLKDLIKADEYSINDILLHTLLHLIAHTEDSNILGRHNMGVLNYSQARAKKALDLGGYLTEEGRKEVGQMDRDFIENNISPGGAADLLGVTIFLFYLENGKRVCRAVLK